MLLGGAEFFLYRRARGSSVVGDSSFVIYRGDLCPNEIDINIFFVAFNG